MKNMLLLKKANTFMFWCVAFLLLSVSSKGYGQLLVENFSYSTPGNLQTAASPNWAAHSGTSNYVQYTNSGLTFAGHAGSGIGGAATTATSGVGDHNRTFTSQNSGTVYMSCLVNVTSITSAVDYVLHFNTASFAARVGCVTSGTNLRFGISKAGAPTIVTTSNFALGTTYMIVVKYTFVAGVTTNDICDLWVLPAFASTEALAGAPLQSTSTGADATALTSVCIRQGSPVPAATIDAFRVGTSWADIAPAASLINSGNNYSATAFSNTYGTASASQSFVVAGSLLTNSVVATAQTGFEVSRSDVVSYGPTATFTAAEANAGTFSVLVRLKNNANAGNYNAQNAVVLSSSPAANVNIVTSASGNTVTPLGLTISGLSSQDKIFDGNTTATLLGSATLNGVLFSDDVSLAGSAVANYSSASVGGPYVVTVSGFSLTGTKAANYSLAQPTVANASITSSTLTDQVITFPALASVPYGTVSVALLAASDNPGGNTITYVSSNTNVATISGSSAIVVGAGTTTITASQAGDVTHNPAIDVPQSLTVTPLGITIIGLSAQDKTFDNTSTATLTGTAVLDPAPINSDDVTISGTPVANFATANVGLQAVTVTGYTLGGTKAGNYSLTQPTVANATINPLAQTITFFGTIPTLTTLTPAVTLTGTASSALPVTFVSSDTNVATISGNVLTVVGPGTVTITAQQAGNSNYAAAPDVAQTRTVETALYLNQFTGTSACPTQGNVATVVANSTGAIVTRSTVTCALLANSCSSTTINNTATINNNSYVEFSATAAAGYRLNLTKLSFARSGSGTCPNQLEVRYSTDGFATSTSMNNSLLTPTSSTTLTWDFTDFNTPVSGTITFRLYPYGTQRADLAAGAAASTGTFRIDDVTIYGTVVVPPPKVTTTTPPAVVGFDSAILGGDVTNTGGSPVTGNGVVISETSLNANPIIGGTSVTTISNAGFSGGTGVFSVPSTGLTPNKQYSYAAYASSIQGTSYGTVGTFYTLVQVPSAAPYLFAPPEVTNLGVDLSTANAPNAQSSVEFAIRVISGANTYYLQANGTLGTNPVWQTTFVWADVILITGLTNNTSYTVDVKARNAAGVETAFGPSTTISTLEDLNPNLVLSSAAPTFGNVCTTGATNFAKTSFTLNGFYLDSADFSVASAAGQLSFSTTENGTYSNPLDISHDSPSMTGQVIWVQFTPSATGAFSSTIAITGGGLASSFDVTATGAGINTPATVTTGAVSTITAVGATIAGTTTAGCSAIIVSGIEYSTASNFVGATQIAGAFPITLSTLSPNTLYYVRAYATDSSAAGIVYGTSTSFTTSGLTTGPIADPATAVEPSSFVANWQAVTGAESYLLDVSTSSIFSGPSTPIAQWNFPNATDDNILDGGIAANVGKTLTTVGGVGAISYVVTSGSTTSAASGAGWDAGNGTKYWQIDINTVGYSNLKLASAQRSSGTGPRDFKVQFSLNGGVNWSDVSGASVTVGNNWTTGVLSNISLPSTCDNQTSVRLRWIMTSNTNVNTTSVAGTGTSGIDSISITGSTSSFVPGYEGLSVNGLTQIVSGLTELTTYYYRVRAFSTNSTSPNSNTITVSTVAAPPTFSSVSYIGSTVCDGANGTFDVAGLNPNVSSKIYYNINGGATESVLTTLADVSGGATFTIPLSLSANNTVLTITTVARADDSSSLTVESGGQVFIDFIAANVTYYSDADSDTYGNPALTQVSCLGAPIGFVANNTDCNPVDGTKWQFATFFVDTDADGYDNGSASVCSGFGAPAGYSATSLGTDCNDSVSVSWQSNILYVDQDGDTFTVGNGTLICYGATLPPGATLTQNGDDCDDNNNLVYQSNTLYTDVDGDTYTVGTGTVTCYGATLPAGTTLIQNGNDCDDNNNLVYQSNPLYIDADGDGWAVDNTTETICYGATVPTGYVLVSLGIDCDDTNSLLTNNCGSGSVVNLTMFIEGYYVGGNTMNSVRVNQDYVSPSDEVEVVTVNLHDATTYELVDTATGTLKTDGTLSVTFTTAAAGSYYVAVKGVNMIETWTATPQTIGTTPLSYDFSSSASQAYEDNMREVEPGVFAFYQGDINQDGAMDNSDFDQLFPDIDNSNFGVQATDLNGDGAIDNSDLDNIFGNVDNSVYAHRPY